jgi:hypothetical protein
MLLLPLVLLLAACIHISMLAFLQLLLLLALALVAVVSTLLSLLLTCTVNTSVGCCSGMRCRPPFGHRPCCLVLSCLVPGQRPICHIRPVVECDDISVPGCGVAHACIPFSALPLQD